ncbi:MAG: tetratricopeptide repeat protein, partial [Betaproteobacteria bacterium]|nr:tetratricopeptide repeat protein [Betaproteobacteria bacterium]
DADLASSAQTPVPPAPQPEPPAALTTAASGQAVARNSFAAKQGPAAGKRSGLWLILGGLALAGVLIAAYVWYQMNSLATGGLAGAGRQPPTAINGEPYTPPVPAELPPIDVDPPVAPLPAEALLPPATPPAATAPPRSTPRPPADSPIRVTRTPPRLDPDLVQAHARLQAGDLAGASQSFALVLQRAPNQTDAMLALAAIAQHQGRLGEAESWRQRALVADPSDPAVQAATLASRAAGGDTQTAESRLKTLLAGQPQSAELNFALGNLYARQQRWADAQQHYFNAVAAEPDNPDYLFNLAVSLDQLRQPRPAAQHYRLALEAARQRPASFDSEQVRHRLADLPP